MAHRVLLLLVLLGTDVSMAEKTDPCSNLRWYSKHEDACYRHYVAFVNQADAEKSCQAKGGHLASVHSPQQHEFLKSLAEGHNAENVWIGLMKVGADYVWTDGSIVKYTNWAPSQPDSGECVRMTQTTSYMWTDGNICNGLFSYICQIEILTNTETKKAATNVFEQISETAVTVNQSATALSTVLVQSEIDCARRCRATAACQFFRVTEKDAQILCDLYNNNNVTPMAPGSSTTFYKTI